MKTGITYIAQEKLMALVAASGLQVEDKKGWHRVQVEGKPWARLYIPKTKKVGRVDVAGFRVEFGAVDLRGESFGAVTQQLDMSLPEEDVLTNFAALLEHLRTLPAPEPTEKKPRGKKQEVAGEVKEDPQAPLRKELDRLLATRRISSLRGIEMSPAAEKRIAELKEELTAPAASAPAAEAQPAA